MVRGHDARELVFATGMSGYQETLTDRCTPGRSSCRPPRTSATPGMTDEDTESRRIWNRWRHTARDPSRVVSNWRANASLDDVLVRDGIVGISGLDTRAVTRRIRSDGSMRGGIFSGPDAALDPDEQLPTAPAVSPMSGQNLSAQVSVTTALGTASELRPL